MGVLDSLAPLAGAGTSIVGDVLNWKSVEDTNRQNKEMWETSMAREDTAVQRRVADLQAAGLNPVLAAGGAAQTMGPIQMKAPQVSGGNPVGAGLAVANAQQDLQQKQASISQTQSQTKLTQAQVDRVSAETDALRQQVKESQERTAGQSLTNVKLRRTMESVVSLADSEAGIASIKKDIAGQDLAQEEVETARSLLNQQKGFLDLRNQEQDLVAKKVATDMHQYDFDWAKKFGIPTTFGADQTTRIPMMAGSAIGRILGPLVDQALSLLKGGR